MHRFLGVQGFGRLNAIQRLEQRQQIALHMISRDYSKISGYSYARRNGQTRGALQLSPRFLYHDILYGYHDDAVLGYGAAAVTQLPGFNFFNTGDRRNYVSRVFAGNTLPLAAYQTDRSPEKGVVTFPYRGFLEKSRTPWGLVPRETLEALDQLVDAGLVSENSSAYEVTETGWLFYVNLMYFLMPSAGRQWISDRISSRMAAGHQCEDTRLH